MLIKKVKRNTAAGSKNYVGQVVEEGTYYTIQPSGEIEWANNTIVDTDIDSGDLIVNNGSEDLVDTAIAKEHLKAIALFGCHYYYAEDDALSSTTSETYIQKLKLTTLIIPAGDYRINWHCLIRTTGDDKICEVRIQLDDTTDIKICSAQSRSGNWNVISGFVKKTLTNAIHDIDIDYKLIQSNTMEIKNAKIDIWRIS